jgi:isoquinoline 1-oxidoreductase subunit alpha
MARLRVNGYVYDLALEPDTPLLWALRDVLGLTGAKYGCGIGQCGACTVLVNGEATLSCVTPISLIEGAEVTTIEALAAAPNHPVLAAWIARDVPQCGYCQTGQIMAATALLSKTPHPTDEDIDSAMINICRCGTYADIRAAIHHAASLREG